MAEPAAGGAPLGVLLLSFGSAVTEADVPEYLRSVRSGREVPPSVVEEFRRRYGLIGRSPLIDITRAQAAALQTTLDSRHGSCSHVVAVGMLHSDPGVGSALEELARNGAGCAVAIVLAPQFSPIIMGGYRRALEGAPLPVVLAGAWHRTPGFIAALAERVVEALDGGAAAGSAPPVIFTAHSLPRSVVDRDPGYIDQLRETADLVAERAGIEPERRHFAYQSAGHTPEEWLKPDFRELLGPLRSAGHREVLVVPTQFLADHLEVLYDIDIAGQEEAVREGMTFRRIAMPNVSTPLIEALAEVVDRESEVARALTAGNRTGRPAAPAVPPGRLR